MAAALRQAFLMGQEITSFVTNWGNLDEVKSVSLAQAQMFMSQMSLMVDNSLGTFTPSNPFSVLYGVAELNLPVTVYYQGNLAYNALLKNVVPDVDKFTAELVIENQLTKMGTTLVSASFTKSSPALAMYALLQGYGFGSVTNASSFTVASIAAAAAGATMGINYASSANTTLLQAINDLANLASLTVFVQNGIIYCSAYQAFQGGQNNLKWPLSDPYVRSWGKRITNFNSYYDQVTVAYGASQTVTLNNFKAQRANGTLTVPSNFSMGSSSLSFPDATSANYFGNLFLGRSSVIRDQVTAKCGPEFLQAVIGDRIPVTSPRHGWTSKAFEIVETNKTLLDQGIELTLVSL